MKSSFESRAKKFPRFLHELDVDLDVDVEDAEIAMDPSWIEFRRSRRIVEC